MLIINQAARHYNVTPSVMLDGSLLDIAMFNQTVALQVAEEKERKKQQRIADNKIAIHKMNVANAKKENK